MSKETDKPPKKSTRLENPKPPPVKSRAKTAATQSPEAKGKTLAGKPEPTVEAKGAAGENKGVTDKPAAKKKATSKTKSSLKQAALQDKSTASKRSVNETKLSCDGKKQRSSERSTSAPPGVSASKSSQRVITPKVAVPPSASVFARRTSAGNQGGWTRLQVYGELMRLNRPIGILLLLWPTLWSLWLAAEGVPRWDVLLIFILGVVVMRSAGCVINDYADRNIDGRVQRTQDRPLARGAISPREALMLFGGLCLLALVLVLLTNRLTVLLAGGGLLLAGVYPFMKRHTYLPQVVLGAAFAWSIPMAFAAQRGELVHELWLIYVVVVIWTVIYDTFYAMVDREDDRRIGVKSTAILFGEQDRVITGFLQLITLYGFILIGSRFDLGMAYYSSVAVAAGFFVYQQYLIRFRGREACFAAFLNNQWVGLTIFLGIAVDFALRAPT